MSCGNKIVSNCFKLFQLQEHIQLTITFLIILIITTKEISGNFPAQYSKPKTITLEKPQLHACQKKMQS